MTFFLGGNHIGMVGIDKRCLPLYLARVIPYHELDIDSTLLHKLEAVLFLVFIFAAPPTSSVFTIKFAQLYLQKQDYVWPKSSSRRHRRHGHAAFKDFSWLASQNLSGSFSLLGFLMHPEQFYI